MELVTATQLPIKLSSLNYPTWYKQLTLLLTANNVLGYVFSTLPFPPATIGTGDTAVENPAFLAWKHQDNYVLVALFGTCGLESQILMSSTTSSIDEMSRLTKVYANQSPTQIMSLKERLCSITNDDSNVCDYLLSICSVADELALIGHSVDDIDLVIVTLNCLALIIMSFVQQSALVTLRCCLMNFLTNLLAMKFFCNGRSDNNHASLLLPSMFLIHLSRMAATNVKCCKAQ